MGEIEMQDELTEKAKAELAEKLGSRKRNH